MKVRRILYSALLALCVVRSVALAAPASDFDRGRALIAMGNTEAGVDLLKKALGGLRGESRALACMELANAETDPVAALPLLAEAARVSAHWRAEAWTSMGDLLLLNASPAEAADCFDSAARLKKGAHSERAAMMKGAALAAAGRAIDAREAYADYLIEYLTGAFQAEARIGIAAANESLGRTREAAEIYKAILAQHPGCADEPWILDSLARLLEKSAPSDAARYKETLAQRYPEYSSAGTLIELPQNTAIRLDPAPRKPVEPARPVEPAPAASDPGKGLYIQIAAFRDQQNADKLVRTLKEKGFRPLIIDRPGLRLVRVGPYRTLREAQAQFAVLEALAGQKVVTVER